MATSLKVWSRFSVTKDTGTIKFRTVTPPQERINDVADFVLEYFAKEESFFRASGIPNNVEAIAEYKGFLMSALKDRSWNTVICCLDNDSDVVGEVIGASFIALTQKDKQSDIPEQPKTKEMQKLLEIVFALKDMYDICEELNVDSLYDGRGVVVHAKYRGCGIAQELLRTRRLICKEHNVPITVAVMTAYGSQKAAERDNWKTVFELNVQDFGNKLGVTFENSPETFKLMMGTSL